MFYKAV